MIWDNGVWGRKQSSAKSRGWIGNIGKVLEPPPRVVSTISFCSTPQVLSILFLKDFIEFVTILLLFYDMVFQPQAIWNLSSLTQESNPRPAALEGEVLTTGLPGKSPSIPFFTKIFSY